MGQYNNMDIQFEKKEQAILAGIFEDKVFKKFMEWMISEKKNAIVEEAEDLEMLHKLRYSLDGNREVLDELESIYTQYKSDHKPKEAFDKNSIIAE